MTYQEQYNSLIAEAQSRNWTRKSAPCYVEVHHIKPRCLGGSNDKTNLVALTAIEHYYAHKYLALIHEDVHGLTHAWWRMCHLQDGTNVPADDYRVARERHAKITSDRLKGKPGKPCSAETKQKLSEINKGKKQTPESVAKRANANKGKVRSAEAKENSRKGQLSETAISSKSMWTYVTPQGNYSNYKEAATANNLNVHTLIYRCKNGIKGFSAIQREDARSVKKGRKAKYMYCTPLGDFKCYKEAAQVNDIKPVTLIARCKKCIMGFSRSKKY